jgi:hypothetical protein
LRAGTPPPDAVVRATLIALLFCAPGAQAQRSERSVDVGGIALRYADTVNTGAAALSARNLVDWGRAFAEGSGTYSQFFSGGWSAQGALSGSFFSQTTRGFVTELGGFAGGSTHNDGTRTGEILGNLRLHFMRQRNEVFGGVGVGRTSFNGGSQTILLGEVGVSSRFRDVDATATVSPVALDSVKYADTQLSLSWSRRNVDFDGVIGARIGDQLAGLGATARAWGSVSAVAWLKPHLAAVFSGGSYPIDPTQGFPGGRFVSASIRISRGRMQEALPAVGAARNGMTALNEAPVVKRFTWEKSGAQSVTLSVEAPRASTVEASGDFTNWIPIQLRADGSGWWSVNLPLKPGKYQMNLRINGGSWIVPPGLLSMVDEFGGSVGLLIVE